MSDKINIDESSDGMTQWATFMKGEKLYELDLPFEMPNGDIFIKTVVYEPATAKMIADIYADIDKNDGVDEQFERMAEMFSLCIRNFTFNNKKPGTSNYSNGEMSVQDLTLYQRNLLEAAIAPGIGKSAAELQQDVKDNSRSLGKKLRGKAVKVAEPAN